MAAQALAAEHDERGRAPLAVIDEAHLLDNARTKAIRMLTNHDMDSGSPIIAMRYAIAGMDPPDPADCTVHHAKITGRTDTPFSDDPVHPVDNAARGQPRAVSNLAAQALTVAFAAERRSSTRKPPASPSLKQATTESLTAVRNPTDDAVTLQTKALPAQRISRN